MPGNGVTAFLVYKQGKKVVKEVALEDRGASQNFKKFGVGKFDRKAGSDAVVVSVYHWKDLMPAS